MNLIFQDGSPPKNREGSYLVRLSKANLGSVFKVYSVVRVSNGFLGMIGGAFDHDYFDDNLKAVAFAELPKE